MQRPTLYAGLSGHWPHLSLSRNALARNLIFSHIVRHCEMHVRGAPHAGRHAAPHQATTGILLLFRAGMKHRPRPQASSFLNGFVGSLLGPQVGSGLRKLMDARCRRKALITLAAVIQHVSARPVWKHAGATMLRGAGGSVRVSAALPISVRSPPPRPHSLLYF